MIVVGVASWDWLNPFLIQLALAPLGFHNVIRFCPKLLLEEKEACEQIWRSYLQGKV
jgi:hypothetical protein